MNDFKSNVTFFGQNQTDDMAIAIDTVAETSSTKAYIVTGETLDVLPVKMHAAKFAGEAAPSVRVAANDDELESYAAAAEGSVEAIELPNTPAARARFIAEWAKKAAKKNKKGIMPLLLLPLAACGGSGGSDADVAISVADLNDLDASTTGIIVETIAEGDLATLVTLTNLNNNNQLTITVTDATADGADLSIVDGATSLVVDATAVGTITGAAADVLGAILAPGIQTSTDYNVTISGDTSVATALLIDADTSGVITATITEDDLATLVTLVDAAGNNALTITVAAGPADAGDLNTVDGVTSVDVDAAAVTSVTGTLAELAALFDPASGVVLADDVAVAFDEVTLATAQDIADLNVVVEGTEGEVTGTMTGAAEFLAGITANADSDADQALTLIVTDAATAAQAGDIAAATSAPTVDFSAAGITDSLANLVPAPGIMNSDVADAVAKDADLGVSISPAIVDASAQDVTDINALLGGTAGIVTATIDGDADVLAGLTATASDAGTNALTIVVNDAATVAEGAAIADATDEGTVDFSAEGIVDTLANLAPGASTEDLDKVAAKDSDVDVEVTDAVLDGTDIANLNAVAFATDGVVSATLEDLLPNLALLDTAPTDAIDVTVTSTTNLAADLLALDGKTSIDVDALAMETIEGTAANIILVTQADGITVDADFNVTVTVGEATVAQVDTIDLVTSGVITATVAEGDLATLITLTNLNGNSLLTITVTDEAASTADLTTVNGFTELEVDATDVVTLTGPMEEVNSLFFIEGGVALSDTVNVVVTDVTVNAAEVNALVAATGGNITIISSTTITGSAADVRQAVTDARVTTEDDYNVTIDAGSAAASDLIAIDADTTGAINIAQVTEITGSIDDVNTVIASPQINTDTDFAITITGGATVAQLNALDAVTTGVITANVTDTDVATLLDLLDANDNNAFTIELITGAARAIDVTSIAAQTSVTLDASNLTSLSGTAQEVLAVLNATDITNPTGAVVVLSAGPESAAGITEINNVPGIDGIDGSALTAIDGDVAAVLQALADLDTDPANFTTDLGASTATAAEIALLETANGTGTIDGSGLTALNGDAASVLQALTDLDTDPTSFTIDLGASTATAAQIAQLFAANGGAAIDGSGLTAIDGDVASVLQALADLDTDPTNFTTDLGASTATAAEIALLEAANGTGTIDGSGLTALNGDATSVLQALADLDTDPTSFTIDLGASTATAAQIALLFAANGGAAIDGSGLTAIDGDAASVLQALADLASDPANFTTDLGASEASALNILAIDTANGSGTIDGSDLTLLTGNIADVNAVLQNAGVIGRETFDVEIDGDGVSTDAATLQTMDDNTAGDIDADAIDAISGSASDLAAIYSSDGISELGDDDVITITGTSAEAADLNTIADGLDAAGNIDASSLTTISGSAADLAELYSNTEDFAGPGNLGDEAVIVTSETSSAADVNTVNDATDGVVNTLLNVEEFTGLVDDIVTLQAGIAAEEITAGNAYLVGITNTSVDAGQITDLIAPGAGKTFGLISVNDAEDINGTEAELNDFYDNIVGDNIETSQNYDLLVESDGGVLAAENIVRFDLFTTGTITSPDANTINGSLDDLGAVFGSGQVMLPSDIDVNFTVSGPFSLDVIDDIDAIIAATSGVISGTLTASAANLATIDPDGVFDAVNIIFVLGAGEADAADINAIQAVSGTGDIVGSALTAINGAADEVVQALESLDTDPTLFNTDLGETAADAADILAIALVNGDAMGTDGVIDGSQITALNGTYEDIRDAKLELGSISGDYTITVEGPMTVDQFNELDLDTTGVITATISDNDMAELLTISDNNGNSALTITVTDASVIATELTTLDGLTTVTIDATAVGDLSGSVAEIDAVLDAEGISNPTTMTATISVGTEEAADLSALLALDNVSVVNATAVTELTGTATEVLAILSEGNITDPTSATVTLDAGTEAAADLTSLLSDGSISAIDASAVTTLTGTVTEINAVLDAVGIANPTTMTATISAGSEAATDLTALLAEGNVTAVDASAVTTLTGTVTAINAVLDAAGITNPTEMAATISAGTEAATDLTALLGEGNVTSVDASAVTTLTGTATEVLAILSEGNITDPTSATVTIDAGAEAAADLTSLLSDGSVSTIDATAVTTLTGTVAEINAVLDAVGIANPTTMTATISAGSEAATDLTALLAEGNVTAVDASAVTTLTGTVTAINAVLDAAGIANPTEMAATISAGTEAATDLTALLGEGNVTSVDASAVTTLSGTVAAINAVLTEENITNPTAMTALVSAGTEAATDLTALLAQDNVDLVNATAVTSLTGSFAEIDAVLTEDGISNPTTMSATISAGSEEAADLSALVAEGNVTTVDATAVTGLSGTATEVLALLADVTIIDPTTATVTIDAGTEAAADLTAVLADGSVTAVDASAVTTLTGSVAQINAVLAEDAITNPTTMTATISAGTEAAADLTTLLGDEIVTAVDASAVTTLTGTVAQINAVLTEDAITNPNTMTATIGAGTEAAADLTALLAETNVTGVDASLVTSLIGTVAEINIVLDEVGITNPTTMTATISEGTEAAADLSALLAEGNVTSVEASAVTTLTGTLGEVNTVLTEGAIMTDGDFDAVIAPAITVAEMNLLNPETTGVISTTIVETDIATLVDLALVAGENALTITVNTVTVDAASLNTVDGTTSVAINATAVTTLTGTAANVATVATADGITLNGTYLVTLDAGSADAADLVTIDGSTTGLVDATAITEITGSAADAADAIGAASLGINTAGDVDVDLTGDAIVADLTDINDQTTGTVLADSITDAFGAIQTLAAGASNIVENAKGTVTANGSSGNDTMDMSTIATTQNDLVINGLSGNDFIIGSGDDDIISGGVSTAALTDNDILNGGSGGNDTFVVIDIETNGSDQFFDFTTNSDGAGVTQGADTLRFTSDDLTGVAGFQSYVGADGISIGGGAAVGFTLASEPSGGTGATFIFDGTTGELSFDADGDGGNAALMIGTFYSDEGITAITDFSASDLEILGGIVPV